MNYQSFKCNSSKEYLGFCVQKGFIYSVQLDTHYYAIVALYNGQVTTLIRYTVQSSATHMKA